MMKTRLMSTAFLFNNDKILMMKRSVERKLAPGVWTGIGGHIEPEEINNPEIAVKREIYEETGIENHRLSDLNLRYVLLRQKGKEIRKQFVYFGRTDQQQLVQSDEGELHWLDIETIHELDKPMIIESMIEHYFEIGIYNDEIYLGLLTMTADNKPEMTFSVMRDPIVV